MLNTTLRLHLLLLATIWACEYSSATPAPVGHNKITTIQFEELMERIAKSWNANDARGAADCFAEDAVYSSPPSSNVHRGREALFQFFGGTKGRPHAMHMQWHHLLFDEDGQIGAGEYTFTYETRTHGVAMVRVVGGKIENWREYEQESPLEWQQFIGSNQF